MEHHYQDAITWKQAVLIQDLTNYLLDQQRRGFEKAFIEKGGYTENLAKGRRDFRGF